MATTNKGTAAKTFNYKGPNLWGVSRVLVTGRGAGTLGEVSCCWKTSTRTCTVVLDSGETVYVEGGDLQVA